MTLTQTWLAAAGLIGLAVTLLWLISLRLRDASIIDVFWGTGFILLNGLYFFLAPGGTPARKWVAALLVTAWGARLSLHIFLRNRWRGEDFRYANWRAQYGARWAWRSYLQVFLLQGALIWFISLPLLAANSLPAPPSLLDTLGVLIWGIGFYFEAAGDAQLARFRADPANRGRLFTGGVWRFTRHPNYFGDAAQWWGFWLLAAGAGGWWTLFSPALMTWLLLRVSGVAMLERTMQDKPGYAAYTRRTSAFVPRLPRNEE
jgi:steroid 5-alpha reductase family enzyme